MIEVSVPGIYISYPFCSQKCTYCNFASGVFSRETEREYVNALEREIQETSFDSLPDTVYMGGGTPSSLTAGDLSRILSGIPGRPWREATIETAPGTVSRELAQAWIASGINRVSLGVQSFVREELRRTGRRHDAEMVAADVRLLRDCGISNINIDLIAGLPLQTTSSWRESLDWIERLDPPHVSVYMLEIDEDSRLGAEILMNGKRYGASDAPDGDTTASMYEAAVEHLQRLAIRRYEISNFARPGYESAHNLKYWELDPYIGFGADAHSFDGVQRWQNSSEIRDYIAGRGREHSPATADEKFFVGLRLMRGVVPSEEEWRGYASPIRRFVDNGLLETSGESLRLTERGVMLSNEVFQEFLQA